VVIAAREGSVDAITVEVMRHAIGAIAEEMHATLVRTARSTNVKDRQDTSSAIYTADGRVVAQSEVATPVHLGTSHATVRYLSSLLDWSELEDGDAIATNLPYPTGPGHLNDIALVSPIFRNGELVALAANQAHHVDVGGSAPGSMPFGVTEIYQEGLQIPPLKLFSRHALEDGLWRMIAANIRAPTEVRGDLEAQLTANALAARRLNELIDRHGEETTLSAFEALLTYSERRARTTIAALPDGVYRFEDAVEGDGFSDRAIRIALELTVAGNEMTFDFSESDDEVEGPLNCGIASVSACVYFAFKSVAGADLPANAGAYRPLQVVVREGSLFSPRYPAPVCNANIITTQRVVDVIFGALAQVVPERVGAACSGTMNLLNIGCLSVDSGHYSTFVETYGGGQGGLPGQDGMDGVQTNMTNTRNAPIEVIEATYPLLVEGYGLRPNSEGAGQFRGGMGIWRRYRIEAERVQVTISTDRCRLGPWGLAGGLPGARTVCRVQRGGRWKDVDPKSSFSLPAESRLFVATPGGGGYGSPALRDPAAITEDVRAGLVSRARAKQVYGAAR
jgi:N-methylhydantoinase B